MSTYYLSKTLDTPFEESREAVIASLKEEGFGVLTEIDVKATLKKKIEVDFRKYCILGACHPRHAYRALSLEDKIGVYLPCSVVVQETADGRTEVAAMNPMVAMQGVQNPDLGDVATQVTAAMSRMLERLTS
jgi:uncharacterized protein (DUF302 family)